MESSEEQIVKVRQQNVIRGRLKRFSDLDSEAKDYNLKQAFSSGNVELMSLALEKPSKKYLSSFLKEGEQKEIDAVVDNILNVENVELIELALQKIPYKFKSRHVNKIISMENVKFVELALKEIPDRFEPKHVDGVISMKNVELVELALQKIPRKFTEEQHSKLVEKLLPSSEMKEGFEGSLKKVHLSSGSIDSCYVAILKAISETPETQKYFDRDSIDKAIVNENKYYLKLVFNNERIRHHVFDAKLIGVAIEGDYNNSLEVMLENPMVRKKFTSEHVQLALNKRNFFALHEMLKYEDTQKLFKDKEHKHAVEAVRIGDSSIVIDMLKKGLKNEFTSKTAKAAIENFSNKEINEYEAGKILTELVAAGGMQQFQKIGEKNAVNYAIRLYSLPTVTVEGVERAHSNSALEKLLVIHKKNVNEKDRFQITGKNVDYLVECGNSLNIDAPLRLLISNAPELISEANVKDLVKVSQENLSKEVFSDAVLLQPNALSADELNKLFGRITPEARLKLAQDYPSKSFNAKSLDKLIAADDPKEHQTINILLEKNPRLLKKNHILNALRGDDSIVQDILLNAALKKGNELNTRQFRDQALFNVVKNIEMMYRNSSYRDSRKIESLCKIAQNLIASGANSRASFAYYNNEAKQNSSANEILNGVSSEIGDVLPFSEKQNSFTQLLEATNSQKKQNWVNKLPGFLRTIIRIFFKDDRPAKSDYKPVFVPEEFALKLSQESQVDLHNTILPLSAYDQDVVKYYNETLPSMSIDSLGDRYPLCTIAKETSTADGPILEGQQSFSNVEQPSNMSNEESVDAKQQQTLKPEKRASQPTLSQGMQKLAKAVRKLSYGDSLEPKRIAMLEENFGRSDNERRCGLILSKEDDLRGRVSSESFAEKEELKRQRGQDTVVNK